MEETQVFGNEKIKFLKEIFKRVIEVVNYFLLAWVLIQSLVGKDTSLDEFTSLEFTSCEFTSLDHKHGYSLMKLLNTKTLKNAKKNL